MKNLQEWFEKGLNQHEYINSMKVNKENLLKVYNGLTLSAEDKQQLQSLQLKQLKAVVLTADWCGDAMVNLPILMRVADEALIETKFLIRDENLELMDQYLTNGTARSIPIIIFLDEDYVELGKWGPRAPEAQLLADQLKEGLPSKDTPDYDAAFKEQFVKPFVEKITTDEALWSHIKSDMLKTLF